MGKGKDKDLIHTTIGAPGAVRKQRERRDVACKRKTHKANIKYHRGKSVIQAKGTMGLSRSCLGDRVTDDHELPEGGGGSWAIYPKKTK